MSAGDPQGALRLDKFLWFARFAKSRALAAAWADDGRIRINGEHSKKASQAIKPGDVLTFAQGTRVRVIKVIAIPKRRGPASEAAAHFEDMAPPAPREAPKPEASGAPAPPARPGKRARREILRVKRDGME